MKRPIVPFLCYLIYVSHVSAASLEWSRTLDLDSGGVSADGLGNVYLTGTVYNSIDPAVGVFDAVLAKYNATGELLWMRQIGTATGDFSNGVSADMLGNVYISGHTWGSLGATYGGHTDAFVSKFDADGNFQWTRQMGTEAAEISYGVTTDHAGNVFIVGDTLCCFDGGDVNQDAFVSKYDSTGNMLWTRTLSSPEHDDAAAVSADSFGNVFVTGSSDGPIAGLPDGIGAYLAKYDGSGNLQWVSRFDVSDTPVSLPSGAGVSVDEMGNIYMSGSRYDGRNPDAFVAKYGADGNLLWAQTIGTSFIDYSNAVSTDGHGRIYILGNTYGSLGGTFQGNQDAFLARYDAVGGLEWVLQPEPASIRDSRGVSADGLGNVYVTGSTEDGRAYLLKYSPDPPQGDYNRDYTVDARDYIVWRDNLGTIVPACTKGDGNCNGFIEWEDYQLWRNNFGRTVDGGVAGASGGSAASVPETSTRLLAALSALWLIYYRHNKRITIPATTIAPT